MATGLVLTASSLGRASQPTDDGALLLVDADNPVIIDVWPQPSRWSPESIRLVHGDRDVGAPAPDDELRWVLSGADRFGTFKALAVAGGVTVESPALVVLPAESIVAAATGGPPPPATSAAVPSQATAPPPSLPPAASKPPPAPAPSQPGPAEATTRAPSAAPTATAPAAQPVPSTPAPGPPRSPAHARPEDLEALVELPGGEHDGRFAAWIGVLFSTLTIALLAFASTRLLPSADWVQGTPATVASTDPGTAAAGSPPDAGTLAERVGLVTSTMLVVLGCVLMLAGAALAALEVRAHHRRDATTPATSRGPGPAMRFLPAILDRASQVRAVIAVLVCAGVVLLVGVLGQLHWAAQF